MPCCGSGTRHSTLLSITSLALFVAVSPCGADIPDLVDADRAIAALHEWAEASGLTQSWRFPRQLRKSAHPSGTGDAWTLDVFFLPPPSEAATDQEEPRFERYLARYQQEYGVSFPDKLFYKFVGVFGLEQEAAAVHLHAGTNDYTASFIPALGGLVFKRSESRFVALSDFLKAPQVVSQARSLSATVRPPVPAVDWPGRIRAFLEDYFRTSNQGARLPGPRIVPDCRGNHVGLKVSGLRRQVFPDGKYWETIQLEIDAWDVPGGVQLSANIDGTYASGLPGTAVPSDYPGFMDHDYPAELRDYSAGLFDKLKQSLLRGTQP